MPKFQHPYPQERVLMPRESNTEIYKRAFLLARLRCHYGFEGNCKKILRKAETRSSQSFCKSMKKGDLSHTT
jgi:hypothetical protein